MDGSTRDRIERLREKSYNSSYDVMCAFMGLDNLVPFQGSEGFQAALIDLLEKSDPIEWTEEQLCEWGLVRLPRDKDGECIHVGDMVYHDSAVQWEQGEWEVISITVSDAYGTCVVCERFGKQRVFDPNFLTHHPPVTVESVLREFGDKYIQVVESPNPIVGFGNEIIGEEDPEKTIAEYAKRLQLVTEVEK